MRSCKSYAEYHPTSFARSHLHNWLTWPQILDYTECTRSCFKSGRCNGMPAQQVEGIQGLVNVLQSVRADSSTSQSSGTAQSPRDVNQTVVMLQWILQEIGSLSPDARLEALRWGHQAFLFPRAILRRHGSRSWCPSQCQGPFLRDSLLEWVPGRLAKATGHGGEPILVKTQNQYLRLRGD